LILSSCSGVQKEKKPSSSLYKTKKIRYDLTDKAGQFVIYREYGYRKKGNYLYTKNIVLPGSEEKNKILEKSISLSTPGVLGKKHKVLRPSRSQYTVWFDGQKYFSEMKVDLAARLLEVTMKSPEKQWQGVKTVSFPKGTGVYCFFTQLIECIKYTGFVDESVKKGGGEMNFHIIWDGYPYFQEQYLNIASNVFSPAKFKFDGLNRYGEKRFTLSFSGQSMFFFFNKSGELMKRFWVSQGLSQLKSEFQ